MTGVDFSEYDPDQPLVEVQTDKALVELPSPVAGQIVSGVGIGVVVGSWSSGWWEVMVPRFRGSPPPVPSGHAERAPRRG